MKKNSEEFNPACSKDNFLVFGAPAIEDAEIDEVVASMKSGWLGTGPKVARFEQDFAEYKGAKNSAAVNSCTAALHLSLLASGLKPGDEVITTPMTFCATVNAIIHAGATIDREAHKRLGVAVSKSELGCLLGTVELTKIERLTKGTWEKYRSMHLVAGPIPYGEKTFAWVFKNPQEFSRPIRYKGWLKLFTIPTLIMAKIN